MKLVIISLILLAGLSDFFIGSTSAQQLRYQGVPIGGSYCSSLYPAGNCCSGRKDDCSVPISTTRCYCDEFCQQHGPNKDCCADYESHCLGVKPTQNRTECYYEGKRYALGESYYATSCLTCTCREIGYNRASMVCVNACGTAKCNYKGSEYAVGERHYFPNECNTCTCKQYDQHGAAMDCVYGCVTSKPEPADCYYSPTGARYRIGELFKDRCKVCFCCAKTGTGTNYGLVRCYPEHCDGDAPPTCLFEGKQYPIGDRVQTPLQDCICERISSTEARMRCNQRKTEVDACVNGGDYGWKAVNYPFLQNRNLDDVYRQRTGVCRPTDASAPARISQRPAVVAETFHSISQWQLKIQPISDQRERPISWAISTAEVATDRMAIRTEGHEKQTLSAQHLVSCVSHSSHCQSTASGWQHLNSYGIVRESCYPLLGHDAVQSCPFHKGHNAYTAKCPQRAGHGLLYRMPPRYKVGENEQDIMWEIQTNGPVQAHVRVEDDFFYYRSGVYRHACGVQHDGQNHYQAVRIIGWGVDVTTNSRIKYWLCTNSWGTAWGENGYFRIRRGENAADIEKYVYGVWPASSI